MTTPGSKPPPHDPDETSLGFGLSDEQWLGMVREARQEGAVGSIGGYELLAEVGRGAQGVVYRAMQPKTKRVVALKLLSAGALASSAHRARFEREVETAAALNHPNIVTVFGVEQLDGQPALAMEWIDGLPIDRWASAGEHGPRGIRERLAAFAQVCDAVQHAHQRGVIHRDLKPSNILVDRENAPHVLDFGLAKLTDIEGSEAARLTMTHDFVGTPAYASPEQVSGRSSVVDTRSDVYSLGVVLYQLVTGVLPHSLDQSLAGLVMDIRERDPQRPSGVNRELDRELDAVVGMALAKAPAERYQSVDALASDIRRYLAGEPVLARGSSATYQVRRFLRRHRFAVSFVATVAVLVTAAAIISTTLAVRLAEQRRAAVAAGNRERDARVAAERVVEFLSRMLAAADPAQARGRDVTVRELLDRAGPELAGQFDAQPKVEAALRDVIGNTYYALGLYDLAEPHLEAAVALRRASGAAPDEGFVLSLMRLANLRQATNREADADALLNEALGAIDRMDAPTTALRATVINNLATLRHGQGRLDEAEREYEQAAALLAKAEGPLVAQQRAQVLKNLADLAELRGDYTRCESLLQRGLQGLRDELGEDHPTTLQAAAAVGRLRFNQGRYDEAKALLERVVAGEQRVLGRAHPDTMVTRTMLAQTLERLGELPAAAAMLREDLAIEQARSRPDDPAQLRIKGNLLTVLAQQGETDEAASLADEVLDATERRLPATHMDVIIAKINLANLRQQQQRLDDAERLLREAVDALLATVGADHPQTLSARNALASVVFDRGETDEAISLYRAVLESQKRTLGPDHLDTLITGYNLGATLVDLDRAVEGEPLLREALARATGVLPEGHWLLGAMQSYLGVCLTAQGRFAEAEQALLAADRILRKELGPQHERVLKNAARIEALRKAVADGESELR